MKKITAALFFTILISYLLSGQESWQPVNNLFDENTQNCVENPSFLWRRNSSFYMLNNELKNVIKKEQKWIEDAINSEAPPQDPTSYMRFGIKLTQHFNYPLMHTSPTSCVILKNHSLYFGPEYNLILTKSTRDSINSWDPEPWGLNIGYRCLIPSERKKTNLFAQINFSFYRVKYKEYEPGSTVLTDKDKMIVENTAGIGINHRFNKKFEIFGGLGFGSTSGFFLLFKHFIPHSFIGVGYKIN
jgi:hypothetical protein